MSPRVAKKRLSYIRAAVLWGRDESRLFDTNPIQGLKIQKITKYHPDTKTLIYLIEDVRKLLRPHCDVDWRATLAANIAWDTGRRITAILSLRVEDIQTDGERIVLRFRKEYDKADRDGYVPISRETAELLADGLEQDIVQEFGWIFPEGRLDYDDARDKPRGPRTRRSRPSDGRRTRLRHRTRQGQGPTTASSASTSRKAWRSPTVTQNSSAT